MRYVTMRGHENDIEQVSNCSHMRTVISKRVCTEAKLHCAYLESQAPGEGGLSKYNGQVSVPLFAAGCTGVHVPGPSIFHLNMINYWTVYQYRHNLKACLHGRRGPQIDEVSCGGAPHLSCKRDLMKMRYYMDWRVTHLSGLPHIPGVPPPPRKQALSSASLQICLVDYICQKLYQLVLQ